MGSGFREARFLLSCKTAARSIPLRLDQPLVSFTFDDVPATAFTQGIPVLEEKNCRATFYISGVNFGNPYFLGKEHISQLIRDGHEIACHSYSGESSGLRNVPAFLKDCEENRRVVRGEFGCELRNFSYPSDAEWGIKGPLSGFYDSMRSSHGGVNSGEVDLNLLRANPVFRTPADDIEILVRKAAREKGWLIFYNHDVDPMPTPRGASPTELRFALRKALEYGLLPVTVQEALKRIRGSVVGSVDGQQGADRENNISRPGA